MLADEQEQLTLLRKLLLHLQDCSVENLQLPDSVWYTNKNRNNEAVAIKSYVYEFLCLLMSKNS